MDLGGVELSPSMAHTATNRVPAKFSPLLCGLKVSRRNTRGHDIAADCEASLYTTLNIRIEHFRGHDRPDDRYNQTQHDGEENHYTSDLRIPAAYDIKCVPLFVG